MMTDTASTAAPERKPHTPATAIRLWSLSERLGRVRYLVYTMAAGLACSVALYAVYTVTNILPPAPARLIATLAYVSIKYLALPMVFCILTIRRLHDFGASGWWSLAVVVPLVALVILAIPGSKLDNRFGPPAPANGEFLNIAAALAPVLLVWVVASAYGKREGARNPQGASQPYTVPAKPAEPLKPYAR